jgi:uncharacterized repeat protein (TIGR03803 family)
LFRVNRSKSFNIVCPLAFLVCATLFSSSAWGQHIEDFQFNYANGSNPQSGLVADSAGNLFGTAFSGGQRLCIDNSGCGLVYELSPPVPPSTRWTEKTLYSFQGGADGNSPVGGLVLDKLGNLYGTTYTGGKQGNGTVFELSPSFAPETGWTKVALYSFQSSPDAGGPMATLTFDSAGNLFGTTHLGGPNQGGAVFELSPPAQPGSEWSEKVLYGFTAFSQLDGCFPQAQVIFDAAGNLYGTTIGGGPKSQGAVYQLTPQSDGSWTETIIHFFGSGKDGMGPVAALTSTKIGAFLGTTQGGGVSQRGIAYGLSAPNGEGKRQYAVLYNFGTFVGDAVVPKSSLLIVNDHMILGTASGGSSEIGAVYQLTPPSELGGAWTETPIYSFTDGSAGTSPLSNVLLINGALYGTAQQGGKPNNPNGTVFRLSR